MKINTKRLPDVEQHLSPAQLAKLLADDRADKQPIEAVNHLDRCATCQSRLTSLAAGDALWSDAQTYLSGVSEPRWEPDTSQVETSAVEPNTRGQNVSDVLTSILGTPNHPEMLGRLGRYDIERVIGSGGMGIVLKAHDSELNRPIAIKLLAPHLAHVAAARERFAREGKAAAAVVHEHVVAIHNVESDGPLPFLVMQYVPGRSLQARVDEDGPLSVEEILRIGVQAAAGLAAAHRQGLVHRDVKPANILLENTVERAILTDFGLARAIDDASLTQTGILAGTPHYMSPEQAAGDAVDHRSDLFSLGGVLYFMATGHPPFRGASALGVLHRISREPHRPVWQANSAIPDELSDVFDRLLEKKPARRFASAEDVQQALAALLSRVQTDGFGRRRFRGWRGRRLRRRVAWIAAASLCCAAVGAAWYVARPSPVAKSSPSPAETQLTQAEAVAQLARERRRLEDEAQQLVQQPDSEFYQELRAAQQEAAGISGRTHYLRHGDDPWGDEIEQARRWLSELESMGGNLPQ